jgi:hypothetical protein
MGMDIVTDDDIRQDDKCGNKPEIKEFSFNQNVSFLDLYNIINLIMFYNNIYFIIKPKGGNYDKTDINNSDIKSPFTIMY